MKSSKENQFDALNAKRGKLLIEKYQYGLTQRQADALERLHKQIEALAPDITPHILRRAAEARGRAQFMIVPAHGNELTCA